MASAWERRNCDQVGPVCRRAGSMPLALRISHTVDAATFMPSPASSPWILRYPQPGFSRASRRTRAWMLRRVAGRPVLPGMDLAARRRQTMSRCQRTIVSGVISSRSPWRRAFGIDAEQGSEQGPVRPVQLQPQRLPALQHADLVAQDQDLRGLPHLLTPRQPQPRGDPHNQQEREVGPRARCRCCHRSSPASPLPHPPCDSHRNGRSACLTRWSAARWRLLVSGSTGSGCCCRGSGSVSP